MIVLQAQGVAYLIKSKSGWSYVERVRSPTGRKPIASHTSLMEMIDSKEDEASGPLLLGSP